MVCQQSSNYYVVNNLERIMDLVVIISFVNANGIY